MGKTVRQRQFRYSTYIERALLTEMQKYACDYVCEIKCTGHSSSHSACTIQRLATCVTVTYETPRNRFKLSFDNKNPHHLRTVWYRNLRCGICYETFKKDVDNVGYDLLQSLRA